MARAQEVSRADAPDLHAFADRLAAQYTVPRPRVYVSPDPTPNAFAAGRNPKHAAIVVNRGLLDLLGPEEAYGVLAHEFAHVRNRDILISSVVAVLAGAITTGVRPSLHRQSDLRAGAGRALLYASSGGGAGRTPRRDGHERSRGGEMTRVTGWWRRVQPPVNRCSSATRGVPSKTRASRCGTRR